MTVQERNLIEQNSVESLSKSRHLLQKMSNSWPKRAQVKKGENEIIEPEFMFDKSRDDFRTDLLPFKDHPNFLKCSPELKQCILSLGWLMYNRKTVDIEARIVTPSCNDILYGNVPGLEDEISQQVVSEVMVDESYHVLLVIRACCITCEERNLSHIKLPTFDLVSNLLKERERCSEKWQQILLQLATSVVSEVFVSDYLDLLCGDTNIQPLNALTVKTHRADEVAHHSIFKSLAKCMYHNLNKEHQLFFSQSLLNRFS
jgi:P-aminobenzoate N-oxygenase AurF